MNAEITTTVVLVSPRITGKKANSLYHIYKTYGEILKEALDYMYLKGVTSWKKAKKELYRYFREKYPDLPSHYIYEAVRDAAARLKSFRKRKKKGHAYTEKPEVKKWSVSCDDHLWKLTFQGVAISTHKGRIKIPLFFHKQFYIRYNSGWVIRNSSRWRIEDGRLKLYVVFTKSITQTTDYSKVIGVDVNENNVTLFT
ncbi:MAG: hypothetical protein QW232_10355, partial [Saccharolobus sp.]